MKSREQRAIKKLSKRGLSSERLQNIFIISTIVIVTALMLVLILYFTGINESNREQIKGSYQASFLNYTDIQVEEIKKDFRIETVGSTYHVTQVYRENGRLNVTYMDENQYILGNYPNIIGRLPDKREEIAVPQNFLEQNEKTVHVGDKISLDLGSGIEEYKISGIIPMNFPGRTYSVIISKSYAESIKGETLLYKANIRLRKADSQKAAALIETISEIAAENNIEESDYTLNDLYFTFRREMTPSQIITIILGASIIAIACTMVIYNIFYIAIVQRKKRYGLLRCIGITKDQIKKLFLKDVQYFSIRAIPLGSIVGALLSYIVMPEGWNFKNTIIAVGIVGIYSYLVLLLSIWKPAKLVENISPIEAIKSIYSQGNFENKGIERIYRRLTPLRLAKINLSRNKKKTVITLLSLGLAGVILFLSQTYLNSIDMKEMARRQFPYGEFKISLYMDEKENNYKDSYQIIQKNNPLTEEFKDELLVIEGVTDLHIHVGTYLNMESPVGENDIFFVNGYDELKEDEMKSHLKKGTGDYKLLLKNKGLLMMDLDVLSKFYGWKREIEEKVIILNDKKSNWEIMGILDNYSFGEEGFFFAPKELLIQEENLSNLNYQFSIGVKTEKMNEVENKLREKLEGVPNLKLETMTDLIDQYQYSFNRLKTPLTVLTIVIFIFGIINLSNTITTNVLSRKCELSSLQAIGMTKKQIIKMIQIEGLFYSIVTILITVIIGGGLSLVFCKVFIDMKYFGELAYRFPLFSVFLFAIVILTAQILISYLSIKYFLNNYLVERIDDFR